MDEKTDIFIQLEQAFPCGLIVNELVNDVLRHCLKYALEGEIFVKIEYMDEGHILIEIGNSDDTISSEFNLKNQKLLGLNLVTLLINQLKGMIEIERGEQTIFKIQFKLL